MCRTVGRAQIMLLYLRPMESPKHVDMCLWLAREIQERIMAGTVRPELAFINASLVTVLSIPWNSVAARVTLAALCVEERGASLS